MQYRKDIDGLRAIAVGSVILFHAGFHHGISGGFFGVDIFFVISGFLIGRILFDEISEGRFSIPRFYERRTRRILPALLAMLLVTYGFARVLLAPLEFADFRNSLLATLGFASNIYFWLHSGYFEAASELKPLLHTWSLGVEEQYYILFPLLAYALRKSAWRTHALVLCAVLSFVWAIATVTSQPNAAFYLLPARAWELLLGALGALWASRQTLGATGRQALSLAGLALITFSITGLDASLPHPGLHTLVPTAGTLLVLAAQAPQGIATRILELPPFVFLGKISYSAYLWHQPIFAYWMHRFGKHSLEKYALLLIAATVVMAYLSWRLIEEPARRPSTTPNRRLALYCGYALALLATIMVPQQWISGSPANKTLQELAQIENLYDYFDFQKNIRNGVCHSVAMPEREKNGCLARRSQNIVLFGDSYAASLYEGLRTVRDADYPGYGIIQLTDGNAPPFLLEGQIDGGASLRAINEAKIKTIASIQPEKIVLTWMIFGKNSTNDPHKELKKLGEVIDRLRQASPHSAIVVIGPYPNWSVSLQKNLLDYLSKNDSFPRYMQQGLSVREQEWDAFFDSHLRKASTTYLSSQKIFCKSSGCLTSVDGSAQGLTAVDWGHLTKAGSLFLARHLAADIFR
ncbi:MAG: acyltransferase family protein [Comamonas sp.]